MKQGTLLKKLVKMSIDDKQIHARESTICENGATYPNHNATIRSFKSKKKFDPLLKKLSKNPSYKKRMKRTYTEYSCELIFIPPIQKNTAFSDYTTTPDASNFTPEMEATSSHASAFIENDELAVSTAGDSFSMSSSSLDPENQAIAAATFANRIWDQDETVYPNLDNVVEWIGDGKSFSNLILKSYMNHYDFKNIKLEQSFRTVCSKLHLKGETQQIDRVLEEFSERYFQCNPNCIFGTADVIHSIVYSVMLLNTDLHVAQGDYKKMTRSEFVKNTMDSIYAQISSPASAEDDSLSDDQLTSGISFQSLDWVPLQRTPSNQSAFSSRSSNYARSFDSSSNRGSNPAPLGSKVWQTEMKVFLKQIYTNIRHNQIADPSSPPTSIRSSRVSTVLKRSVGTIIWKGGRDDILSNQDEESPISYPISPVSTISTQRPPRSTFSGCRSISSASSNVSNSLLHYQSIASYLQHTELPTTYTSNAPYYKEGMVTRKHLLEKANHKAKHRDWKDCFMVIDRSQLRMYKLDANSHKYSIIRSTIMANRTSISDNASQVSDSSSEAHAVGGGDWLSNAQLIGIIDLKHTLATPLTSGYSRQRQHAFALQQPSGGVYLFQAGSNEQIQEWVSTCNYWAARESKEPMAAAVGSMEYGWCNCLERSPPLDDITIHEWRAPLLPTISSLLEEAAQLDALHKYVQELNNELDQHHDIKPKMELLFSSHSKNAAKVNANWENKSTFLLHEIIKYQNYCDSIEKSLALQAKVMEPQH